jgi:hypothetical protein
VIDLANLKALSDSAHREDSLAGLEAHYEKIRNALPELIEAAAERDALENHGLDEYARGVVDGSEINVNILAESKADLEEQRQEIGRLRADIERMRPVYEAAAACPLTSSDGWLMCQLRAKHGGACDMKDISLPPMKWSEHKP